MKRKTMTMLLCLLTVLSIVGVGFASWVITAEATEIRTGNIVVDTVTDERLSIIVSPSQFVSQPKKVNGEIQKDAEGNVIYEDVHNTALDINFTAPKTTLPITWLKVETDADYAYECLTVSYTATITRKDGNAFNGKDDVDLTATFVEPEKEYKEGETTKKTAYALALEAGCFELASGTEYGETGNKISLNGEYADGISSTITISNDNRTITYTVVVRYVWGKAFGYKNPFNFYNETTKVTENDKQVDKYVRPVNDLCNVEVKDAKGNIINKDKATWGDHAAYYLGLLEDIAATASYSLTITAQPK